MPRTFTPQEITDILSREFAAPLIITTLGWIIYGVNLCQFVNYFIVLSKRDHNFTKIWVSLVMLLNTAASLYQVYFDWSYSISGFTAGSTSQLSHVNGNVVVLYSIVVTLVQLFWLGCVNRMMASRRKLSWFITIPIGLVSVSSFIVAIALGALSDINKSGPSWPTSTISKLLRIVLGLVLGVDLAILIVIVTQLTSMKRNSVHLRRTVSKLSYIFCSVTIISSLIIIVELIINFPRAGNGGLFSLTITFAPVIAPLYTFGMLSVLNARTDLWSDKNLILAPGEDRKGLLPGMNFTVDLAPAREDLSRDIPLTDAANNVSNLEDYRREPTHSISDVDHEKDQNDLAMRKPNDSEA